MYNNIGSGFDETIEHMTDNYGETDGTYPISKGSIGNSVGKFIEEVIRLLAEAEQLYDDFFIAYIADLLDQMSSSLVLAFRHTGIY